MAENKGINLNTEEKAKLTPNISTQKPLPQRPLPSRPNPTMEQNTKNEVELKQTQKEIVKKEKQQKIKAQKVKKEKIKKPKEENIEEKQETQKNSKISSIWLKYRLYFFACLAVVGVFVIAFLIIFFSIKAKENQPLVMDSNAIVTVVAFNGQYYLEAPESEEAYYYVFELTANENPVLIFSRVKQIDVSQYFNQQAIFTIRYYIQKESDASRSASSLSVQYAPQEQLSTPVLRLNEETNQLEWNYVLNAESYMFYYASGEEILTYEYFPPIDDEDNIGSFMPDIDFGVYNISIVAMSSDSPFYVDSEQSNIIVVSNFETQQQVLSASYSLVNQTIFIDASNLQANAHNFAVYIGEQVLYFSPTEIQNTYQIDLAEHGQTIILGDTVSVVTLGTGEFLFDSEPKICTPQN